MVRYVLDNEVRELLKSHPAVTSREHLPVEKIKLPYFPTRFVDILEMKDDFYKVRVFVDSEIFVGWVGVWLDPIHFYGKHELLDGRFNSDKVA